MPSQLKSQLRYGFVFGDKETVVELNKAWFTYVREMRKLAQEEAEAQANNIGGNANENDEEHGIRN